jgi:hypothetical protein
VARLRKRSPKKPKVGVLPELRQGSITRRHLLSELWTSSQIGPISLKTSRKDKRLVVVAPIFPDLDWEADCVRRSQGQE